MSLDVLSLRPSEVTRMRGMAVVMALCAIAAASSPIWAAEPTQAAGLLLLLGAATETLQGFRRRTAAAQRSAWTNAALTLALALLLLNAPWLTVAALVIFVAVPFALDAARHAWSAIRLAAARQPFLREGAHAVWNIVVVVAVVLAGRYAHSWALAFAAGLRLVSTAVSLASAPVYTKGDADRSVIADLHVELPERLAETGARIRRAEELRVAADRSWIIALLAVLFVIHVSRMGLDRSSFGILSPLIAVVGDVVFALGLTYLLIVPFALVLRRLTRGLEERAWDWVLAAPAATGLAAWPVRVVRAWLEGRLRFAMRLRTARYSLPNAIGRGLHIGLPLAAIIVASIPVWGMSWYFDTENWAAGIWNSWAAQRTDVWRAAMIQAVVAAGQTSLDGRGFTVDPGGLGGSKPFSFVVIGDTGEGDASQHVLRDSLIRAAAADEVRFVVISSDVVYPTGAMKDYEARFWLPFKGVTKPVYAIPGNHDWYDALEAFNATFLTADAARTAMHARVEADHGLSSTTTHRIDQLIREAAVWRREYRVPTGFQHGPFFQIQTPDFALIAVDTGVMRRIDDEQMSWLRAALDNSRGKMVMAILGHPLFAGGRDVVTGDKGFEAVRDVLHEHDVRIVMAGDTHDLEYYPRVVDGPSGPETIYNWVNGGGGAYLSFGAALAWPAAPATAQWAFYPNRASVEGKITAETPWWKWPAWIWTRRFGAWPASAEWLSAMFDYNVAPFFQSFDVVTVDPAGRTVTVRPWGIYGPLTWRSLERSAGVVPTGVSLDRPVEWVVSFKRS